MSDEKTMAEMFYGSPKDSPKEAQSLISNPDGSPKKVVAEMPKDDVALFYADTADLSYDHSLQEGTERLADAKLMSREEITAYKKEAAGAFFEANIQTQEAGIIHDLVVQHTLKPPTPEEVRGWEAESKKALREKYGDEAKARLDEANSFMQRHPRFQKALTETGTGSHPKVVLELAERAWRLKLGQRL